MISYIKGKIIEISEDYIILETNGVGYKIKTCQSLISRLNRQAVCEFFIYPSFSMYEGFNLYGFLEKKHLEIFELLMNSIPNTGPKKAIEYLNKILKSPEDFKKAIQTKDTKTLKNLFGFTAKTSDKLILSLKDRIQRFETSENQRYESEAFGSSYETALNALISLGYKVSDSREALNSVLEEKGEKKLTIEDLIKLSLRKISSFK
ncbi:MAG TPA: Holliday junction ATP-dependent DNA helicase RuvA [Elusimicrobiales bacterium]|nr:Holliday junction ATP-dependent DNA helicase RuvA [Elusimicrobiales bacterium]